MEELKYSELEERSMPSQLEDTLKKLEATVVIQQQIELMKQEGKVLSLTEEEINLLQAFRRFKIRMRKNGEIFTWQSSIPEGVQIVEDTAEIILPNEK